jgi:WD40 repeat protein
MPGGPLVRTLQGHVASVQAVIFSPSSRRVTGCSRVAALRYNHLRAWTSRDPLTRQQEVRMSHAPSRPVPARGLPAPTWEVARPSAVGSYPRAGAGQIMIVRVSFCSVTDRGATPFA